MKYGITNSQISVPSEPVDPENYLILKITHIASRKSGYYESTGIAREELENVLKTVE